MKRSGESAFLELLILTAHDYANQKCWIECCGLFDELTGRMGTESKLRAEAERIKFRPLKKRRVRIKTVKIHRISHETFKKLLVSAMRAF